MAGRFLAGSGLAAILAISSTSLPAADLSADNVRVYGRLEVGPTTNAAAPTNGLILYYSFDAGSDTTVADDSGNGRNGTVHSATWIGDGVSGGAYRFDGANDYMTVNNPLDLGTNNFSVSFWFNGLSDAQEHSIVFIGRTSLFPGPVNGAWYVVFDNSSGSSEYRYGAFATWESGSNSIVKLPTFLVDYPTGWHHLAAVREGTTLRLFIDGQQKASNSAPLRNVTCDVALDIGRDVRDAGGYYEGVLDEMRLYDRALSTSEVNDLFQNPSGKALAGRAVFHEGVEFVAPLGDIPMGAFTNR